MKKLFVPLLALALLTIACARATNLGAPATIAPTIDLSTSTSTWVPTYTLTPTKTEVPATETPTLTPTPAYPPDGRGPTDFAANVDPLTGLEVSDPTLLDRRPLVIKVENIPREHRPQWGLSLADVVWEYYTEFGATRFSAVFYGNNAQRVGPIRSGRFFDTHIVQMYDAVFVYGSAYPKVQDRFFSSDFARRLILETVKSCPALCRYEPNGQNLLVADTTAMNDYLKKLNVDNTKQNQDGMFFKLEAPNGGSEARQVYVRYSGAIYNRWDYDPSTGSYLRYSDKVNDVNRTNEVYEQLTDRLTGKAITAENVVTLCVPHQYYVKKADSEVIDIILNNRIGSYVGCDGKTYKGGTGVAYIARDGKMYKVLWSYPKSNNVLALTTEDGKPFPMKPGQTWYEVIGSSSKMEQQGSDAWRFTHVMGLAQ